MIPRPNIIIIIALFDVLNHSKAVFHYADAFIEVLPARNPAIQLRHRRRVDPPKSFIFLHHLFEIKKLLGVL